MSQVPRLTRWRHRGLALLALAALLGGACGVTGRVEIPGDATSAPSRPASTPATTPTTPATTVPPRPRFVPTAEVAGLARSMSDEGRRIFYDTNPKVFDRAEFATVCPTAEHAQVLGCYTGDRIYILRVARPELAGVMETTAVHEMLHAVYSSLRTGERVVLDKMVDELYGRVADVDLRELVASYERSEPGQRLNELHSILPTQVGVLEPRLEDHYRRYISSRQAVVAAYKSYQGLLEQLESRIDAFHADIARIKTQLDALEARIRADRAALEQLNRRLETLEARGDLAGYNRLIPQQNTQVRALNRQIDEHGKLVDLHNLKVKEVNELALEQNQLVASLEGAKP